jgi:hypothetical protein
MFVFQAYLVIFEGPVIQDIFFKPENLCQTTYVKT